LLPSSIAKLIRIALMNEDYVDVGGKLQPAPC
jgi:hypothetical protein